jgi:hypothetical protein
MSSRESRNVVPAEAGTQWGPRMREDDVACDAG